MLAFYSKIRLFISSLLALTGLFVHYEDGFGGAWYLYLAAAVLFLTHFLFGNVWLAFGQLKKGNLTVAGELLETIHFPEWLVKGHRAYYFFTKGMLELQIKQTSPAKKHLEQALQLGLRTDNDKALAALNLAHIAFLEKDFVAAQKQVQRTKSFNSKDLMIKENIHKMEHALQGRFN